MERGWLLDQQSLQVDEMPETLETFQGHLKNMVVKFYVGYMKEQQDGKVFFRSCHSCFGFISGLQSMHALNVINDHCKHSVGEQVVGGEEDILNGDRERTGLYANYFSLQCPKVGFTEFVCSMDHWCQGMANLEHFNPCFRLCSICMSIMAAVACDPGSPACSWDFQLRRVSSCLCGLQIAEMWANCH